MIASRRAAAALSSSGVFGLPILRTGAAGCALEVTTFVEREFGANIVFRCRLFDGSELVSLGTEHSKCSHTEVTETTATEMDLCPVLDDPGMK